MVVAEVHGVFHVTGLMALGVGRNVGGAYIMWAAKGMESKVSQIVCL